MVNQDGDYKTHNQPLACSARRKEGRPTLHPSFPLVRLFPVQESHVFIPPDRSDQPDPQGDQYQDAKRPYVVLFLFLQEHAGSVGKEEVEDGRPEDGERHGGFGGDEQVVVLGGECCF